MAFPEIFGNIWDSKRHFHETEPDELLDVVFEDEDILIVNKPAGLVCHPTRHGPLSSIIGRVRLYLGGEPARPHFVNRLDRETSGLLVVAKNESAAEAARFVWQNRSVKKDYLAIIRGHPVFTEALVDGPMAKDTSSDVRIRNKVVDSGGKPARTLIRILERRQFGDKHVSLARVRIGSGRKHQIRIHAEWIGFPIVGDKIYGGDESCYCAFLDSALSTEQRASLILPYQALHAWRLEIPWKGSNLQVTALPDANSYWHRFKAVSDMATLPLPPP